MAQAQQEQDTQHLSDLDALRQKHDADMKALQMRFNEELAAERAKLEEEKEADLTRLQEALSGSLSQQQELQLQMLKEQHDRELEAVREELVRTHMEKFTEMTARLESEHEVCLFVCLFICLVVIYFLTFRMENNTRNIDLTVKFLSNLEVDSFLVFRDVISLYIPLFSCCYCFGKCIDLFNVYVLLLPRDLLFYSS